MGRKIQPLLWLVMMLVISAFTLSGCGGKPTEPQKTQTALKTITIGSENESDKINPIFTDEHDDAVALIFSGLTRFNEKNEAVPDLAESWEVSADQLTYVFKLRKDVKWHDGKPFTAEDVKFTVDQAVNPKNNS